MASRYVRGREQVTNVWFHGVVLLRHDPRPTIRRAFNAIDARVAAHRWGLPARQPIVALLAAVVLLGTGLSVAATRPPQGQSPIPNDQSVDAVDSTYVGPNVGDNVESYIARRKLVLSSNPGSKDSALRYAVVSFSSYLPIEVAHDALSSVTPKRVFFDTPLAANPNDVGQVAVSSFVKDTLAAFAANAAARAKLAQTFAQYAKASPSATDAERKFRDFYLNYAKSNEIEAEQLAKNCACVFGVVVQGSLASLRTLAAQSGVRLVDLAPVNIPQDELGFRPIAPEETGVLSSGQDESIDPQDPAGSQTQ